MQSLVRPTLSGISAAYGCYECYANYADPSNSSPASMFRGVFALLFSVGLLVIGKEKTKPIQNVENWEHSTFDPVNQLKSHLEQQSVNLTMKTLFEYVKTYHGLTSKNYLPDSTNVEMKAPVMWGFTPSKSPYILTVVNLPGKPIYNVCIIHQEIDKLKSDKKYFFSIDYSPFLESIPVNGLNGREESELTEKLKDLLAGKNVIERTFTIRDKKGTEHRVSSWMSLVGSLRFFWSESFYKSFKLEFYRDPPPCT